MGADYIGQEKAIDELNALSNEAKQYLAHHIRNSLAGIVGAIALGELEVAKELVWHIEQDIKKFGC